MRKIDLMIIGAQKAGTTSLKNYLSQHPQIQSHLQTEFSYFTDLAEHAQGYNLAFKKYISNKELPISVKIVAKNAAIYISELDLQLLREHNPNVILVLLLRNPIERAYSAYNMEKTFNANWMQSNFNGLIPILEQKDFDNIFYKLFIRMGLYSEFMEVIYKYFPKNQVKVFLFEDLVKDPLKICQSIFKDLGISTNYQPDVSVIHNKTAETKSKNVGRLIDWLRDNDNFLKRVAKRVLPNDSFVNLSYKIIEMNKSSTKPIAPLDAEVRTKLEAYFRPYNKKIETITGVDVSSWESE